MNESGLIKAVERHLWPNIHKQSMTSASLTHRGTPDRYYDGPVRDLWVEYKMLKAMPRNRIAKGNLSALQLEWLTRRYDNSKPYHNAAVIVGLPDKTACVQVMKERWLTGTPIELSIPLKEVAAWINAFCGESLNPSHPSYSTPLL